MHTEIFKIEITVGVVADKWFFIGRFLSVVCLFRATSNVGDWSSPGVKSVSDRFGPGPTPFGIAHLGRHLHENGWGAPGVAQPSKTAQLSSIRLKIVRTMTKFLSREQIFIIYEAYLSRLKSGNLLEINSTMTNFILKQTRIFN